MGWLPRLTPEDFTSKEMDVFQTLPPAAVLKISGKRRARVRTRGLPGLNFTPSNPFQIFYIFGNLGPVAFYRLRRPRFSGASFAFFAA